jgi:transposase
MTRIIEVHRPTTAEVQQLTKGMLKLVNPHQQRRAEALILYGMGLTALEIAQAQDVHPNTVYKDLHAFEQEGVAAVRHMRESGVPVRITAVQISQIMQVAEQSPQTLGLPYGRWSLRKLNAYLVKKHLVKSVGRERLRQLLKKRFSLSARAAQIAQPRPTAPGNSGAPPLDFQAFAHRWAPLVFRRQADCGQSLWRAALHHHKTVGVVTQSKNAWSLLPLYELRCRQW